ARKQALPRPDQPDNFANRETPPENLGHGGRRDPGDNRPSKSYSSGAPGPRYLTRTPEQSFCTLIGGAKARRVYFFAGCGMERPLPFSATMNSRKRRLSVVLGFQCAWIVPAGTKRLSPACRVTGGFPSSCQMPVPDTT